MTPTDTSQNAPGADALLRDAANLLDALDRAPAELGRAVAKDDAATSRKLTTETNLAFVRLRQLNRMVQLATRDGKRELQQAKATVDRLNLELQNLLYEKTHLKRELAECLGNEARYLNVLSDPAEALPTAVTQALPPAEEGDSTDGSGDAFTRRDYALLTARLEHEKGKRQELVAVQRQLEDEGKKLAQQVEQLKNELGTRDSNGERFEIAARSFLMELKKSEAAAATGKSK